MFGKILVAITLTLVLAGCASPNKKPESKLDERPKMAKDNQIPPSLPGSLWQESIAGDSIFSDSKPRRINDIITILVSEADSANNKATTKTGRKTNTSAGITNMFGLEKNLSKIIGSGGDDASSLLDADYNNQNDSSGNTAREGKFTATISARVVEIFPTGIMAIEGTKEIKVNNEKQYLIIFGFVRPQDISAQNEIESAKIADLRIEYSGDGIVSDKQRAGWLSRILDVVWPF